MATILFFPFPETGHLNPTFKLARSLRARGHLVRYLVLPDFHDAVERQHLDVSCMFENAAPRGFIHQEACMSGTEIFEMLVSRAGELGQAFDPLREMQEINRRFEPDLMIIDLLLPPIALIVKGMGLQILLLNTQLFNPWQDWASIYGSLEDLPELILCPEEFDFPWANRRERCYYVEASIDLERVEIEFPWDRLDPHKRIVYCSLGTQSHLVPNGRKILQAIIDAISMETDLQLVLTTGAHLRPEEFRNRSANVILTQWAPQLELLKRTSVMITHGGFNSIKECILFEVPMIVFPLIRDQPQCAARVVHHGLGLRGNVNRVSPQDVRSLIRQIEGTSSFRDSLRLMADRFRELERSGKAVQIIESMARGTGNKTAGSV
jgi:UDP:flavonoid glycosyltransferase YjiC (YdhE family)